MATSDELWRAASLIAATHLGLVFAGGGASKLLSFPSFVDALESYGLARSPVRGSIALGVPAIEVCVGVGVFAGPTRFASVGAAFLILSFTAATVVARAAGESPVCRCLGETHSATNAGYLGVNARLGVIALVAASTSDGYAARLQALAPDAFTLAIAGLFYVTAFLFSSGLLESMRLWSLLRSPYPERGLVQNFDERR